MATARRFPLFCWSLYTQGHHYLPVFVTMALILGLLGDVWLDFKYVYKDNEQAFTYAGFIMFGLGHVLFIAGLFLEFFEGNNPLYIIIPFVGGLLISVVNLLLEKVMKLNYGKMKPIAFIYGWLLFTMTLTALSLCILHGFTKTTLIMFFVGGLLFTLSDLILSGTYFGQGKERPIDIATNAVTYYAAQFVIAFAVFFI